MVEVDMGSGVDEVQTIIKCEITIRDFYDDEPSESRTAAREYAVHCAGNGALGQALVDVMIGAGVNNPADALAQALIYLRDLGDPASVNASKLFGAASAYAR